MSSERQLDRGDKWFAAFISVAITIGVLLGVGLLISLEMAIWGGGVANGLVWHAVIAVIGWISSKVYVRVLKGMPKW